MEHSHPVKHNTFANYCFVFAVTVLFYLFSNLLITGVIFLFKGHLTIDVAWISAALTLIFAFVVSDAHFKHSGFPAFLIVLAIIGVFAGSIFISKHFYDVSYDGQTYQQEAVIQLSNGWNPVYRYLDPNVIGLDQKWINYYPKSAWINESYIYLMTHEIQTGKALNIILMVVAAALVYAALRDAGFMGPWSAGLVALVTAANPVSIVQMFSYYIDGQLMSLFIGMLALLVILYYRARRFALLALFLIVPIFVNLKFTAVVDAVAVLGIYMAMTLRGPDTRWIWRTFVAITSALAIGILLIGASPYITNVIRYQTPFYPLAGGGAIDLKPYNVPGDYINKGSAEIFFLSFFAKSGTVLGATSTTSYKLPFTYASSELPAFTVPDADEGGFGPLFGGAIVLTFLVLAVGYFVGKKNERYRSAYWATTLLIVGLIGISVIDPISSLARYVPQGYLIAIVPIVLLLSLKKKFPALVAYLMLILLFFNISLIATSYIAYNIKTSSEISAELALLAKESQTKPILIHFNEFKSNRVMFAEAGIRYISVDNEADCMDPQRLLPANTTEFCGG